MPEINARDERKQQWQDRRDQPQAAPRRARAARRPAAAAAAGSRGRPASSGQQQRAATPRSASRRSRADPRGSSRTRSPRSRVPQIRRHRRSTAHEHDALARVGTPLGDAAAAVFAQLRNGQPLPVRQLAAMMRKRNLVEPGSRAAVAAAQGRAPRRRAQLSHARAAAAHRLSRPRSVRARVRSR